MFEYVYKWVVRGYRDDGFSPKKDQFWAKRVGYDLVEVSTGLESPKKVFSKKIMEKLWKTIDFFKSPTASSHLQFLCELNFPGALESENTCIFMETRP